MVSPKVHFISEECINSSIVAAMVYELKESMGGKTALAFMFSYIIGYKTEKEQAFY